MLTFTLTDDNQEILTHNRQEQEGGCIAAVEIQGAPYTSGKNEYDYFFE